MDIYIERATTLFNNYYFVIYNLILLFTKTLIYLIKYVAGSTKGGVTQGDTFNDPFRLGKVDPQYTSSRVTTTYNLTGSTTTFNMNWKPVVQGTVSVVAGDATYVDDGNGKIIQIPAGGSVARKAQMVQEVNPQASYGDVRFEGVNPTVSVVVYDSNGDAYTTTSGSVDYSTGVITITAGLEGSVEVSYSYNNAVIPQNDIPLLSAKMESMPLLAKARRIAVGLI